MKKIFSMAAILALLVFLPFSVMARPTGCKAGKNESGSAGKYTVFVLTDKKWQPAGALSFDKHLREKRIDLRPLLRPEEKNQSGPHSQGRPADRQSQV